MSEDAVNYLIKAATGDRGPGKRVVKPSAALLDLALPEDDESDEDFDASRSDGDSDDDSNKEESDSDEDGSENDSEDSGDGDVESGNETKAEESKDRLDESVLSATTAAAGDKPALLCCLCLNLRPSVHDDEVIQCDKCGLAVHENCYMVDSEEMEDSDDSSSQTEPWFCEPCVYGLDLPPHCELCPNRFGAFKRSDIGGKWVHLLCALYSRGVTFGEVTHLTAVSWQELDYRLFGKKACSLCDDKLLARTGVCSQCEAGLCKTYFHATCAQKYGLLVDNSETESDDSQSTGMRGMNKLTVDPRFINCKRHANDDVMRTKRKAYLQFERQEDKRMLTIRRKVLTDREERKRKKALIKYEKMFKELEGITIFWPEREQKRPRQVHTSAEYLEAFIDKAEQNGQSREEVEKEFRAIKVDQLPFLPAAFSAEFVGYYSVRESKHIPHDQKRLDSLKASHQKLKAEQTKLQEKYNKLEVDSKKSHSDLTEAHNALTAIFTAVSALGCKNVEKPKALKPVVVVNKQRSLNGMSKVSPQKAGPSAAINHQPMRLKMCAECLKSTDQHLLAYCDTCAKDYHLACLDPPLTRMPKKTAQYGWECSKCADDSESDDKSVELGVPNTEETEEPRKLRQRSSLSKPKRAADEIALENAIAASFKRKRGRPTSKSAGGDTSVDQLSPAAKRARPPKLTKYSKEEGANGSDGDSANDVSNASDGPHELVDEKIITVKTTKEPKTRRMQYPTTRLNDAVASVLKGRMNIKQAAERFNVPRSTVQRRITLSREEHKRRASSMGGSGSGSDLDKKPQKAEVNGNGAGDDLADENIDVGSNPTPPPTNKDEEVDVDSVSDNCSDSMKLVRRRRRKGAEVIVVEDLNLS